MWIIFKLQKFSLRVLLRICLSFCQFQFGVAYNCVAYKKACISKSYYVMKKGEVQLRQSYLAFWVEWTISYLSLLGKNYHKLRIWKIYQRKETLNWVTISGIIQLSESINSMFSEKVKFQCLFYSFRKLLRKKGHIFQSSKTRNLKLMTYFKKIS